MKTLIGMSLIMIVSPMVVIGFVFQVLLATFGAGRIFANSFIKWLK